jgi:hypothetical protein
MKADNGRSTAPNNHNYLPFGLCSATPSETRRRFGHMLTVIQSNNCLWCGLSKCSFHRFVGTPTEENKTCQNVFNMGHVSAIWGQHLGYEVSHCFHMPNTKQQ